MQFQAIPQTDLTPSAICLGAFPFGVSMERERSFDILDHFAEAGGNFIDTAIVYGEWLPDGRGISEKYIGEWMKTRRARHRTIVGTKGGHPDLSTMHVHRLSGADIAADVEQSLRHLQTDYIDLYWLHRDSDEVPVAELLGTLNAQREKGNIRYFGCSNWRVDRLREATAYAEAHGMAGFVANQPQWSLARTNREAVNDDTLVFMDQEAIEYHSGSQQAVVPYTSQAKGFFEKAAARSLAELPDNLKARYLNEENVKRLARLQQLSAELDQPITVLALAYLLSQPFPVFPIAGCSSLEQLAVNVKAGDVRLSEQEVRFLDGGGY